MRLEAVSTGTHHTMILKTDGTLWGAGRNRAGMLGDGTDAFCRTSFVRTKDDTGTFMTDIKAMAAGHFCTVAVREDGTLWGTGVSDRGQLGNGTNETKHSYTQAKDDSGNFITGVKAVSVGRDHTLALKEDGTIWAAGGNDSGQLGDGTKVSRNTFVQIKEDSEGNPLTDVKAISAGYFRTFIIKSDDSLWGAGNNSGGRLGFGVQRTVTKFVKLADDVKKVNGDDQHTGWIDSVWIKY